MSSIRTTRWPQSRKGVEKPPNGPEQVFLIGPGSAQTGQRSYAAGQRVVPGLVVNQRTDPFDRHRGGISLRDPSCRVDDLAYRANT